MPTPIPVAILDEKMTAAGSPFELDEAVINGIPTRIWKNTAPSLRAIFEDTQQFC